MDEQNIIRGPVVSEETFVNTAQYLHEYLEKITKNYLDKVVMVDAETGEEVTNREVVEYSYTIASYLLSLGCGNGSVVGIVLENRFEYLSLLLATLQAEATCTFINPLYSTRELSHAFKISKPMVVFASSKTYDKVKELQEANSIKEIINVDTLHNMKEKGIPKYCDTNGIQSKGTADPSKTAAIVYSSGTSGLSKGVELMHKSFIFVLETFRTEQFLQFPQDNSVSGILPMCHVYGLFSILSCFALGHKYVLIKRYSETSFLQYIEKYRICTLYIVPTIALFLSNDSKTLEYDLSSVRFISIGGGSIRRSAVDKLRNKLRTCNVLQNYGMTETTAMCLISLPTSKSGATGRLIPGMEAKIIDEETGTALGALKSGELFVRGPMLMKGYCGDHDVEGLDSEGWLHTGDIAYYDDNGEFYVIDRIKELIKYKGFQVPPTELENLLTQHPSVSAAAVVGVPDEVAGELPKAYVVLKAGAQVTEKEIEQYVGENISPQKKLRGGVKFVNELPKTVIGKLHRKEIKKWVAAGL